MSLFDSYPDCLSQKVVEGSFDPNKLIDRQLKFAWAYVKSYGFKEVDFDRRMGFEIYIYYNETRRLELYARRTGFFPDYWPVVKVVIR